MSGQIETRRALGAVAGGVGIVGRRPAPSLSFAAPVARCMHCGTGHSYPFAGLRDDPVAALACPGCNRTGSVPMEVMRRG